MSLNQSLHLRPQQSLSLSQRQAIEMLQLSQPELLRLLDDEISRNPVLEWVEDSAALSLPSAQHSRPTRLDADQAALSFAPLASPDEARESNEFAAPSLPAFSDYLSSLPQVRDDYLRASVPTDAMGDEQDIAVPDSLREYLLRQLAESHLKGDLAYAVVALIDSLDERGLIPDELTDILPLTTSENGAPVSLATLRTALAHLQTFDPAGIAARSVPEALCTQVARLSGAPDSALKKGLYDLIKHHWESVLRRDFVHLKKVLKSHKTLVWAEVWHTLTTLQPYPAFMYQASASYIAPDLVVQEHATGWQVFLNAYTLPRVQVHSEYKAWCAKGQLRTELRAAKELMHQVQHYYRTLLRVAQAIVQRQQAYFNEGKKAIVPMILQDIATELGVHESTVSRATRHKYLISPQGTIELSAFFSNGLSAQDGQVVSTHAIRALLVELVQAESATAPLSDSALCERLKARGYLVARRTVAKYREMCQIPSVAQRRLS